MKDLLIQLVSGRPLSQCQATEAFERIMTGQASPAQVAALLALIQARGASVDELVGAAKVMREKLVAVDVPPGLTVLDTCGTGGTHSRTFNISTTSALVVAAVGRPRNVVVAKHGNRSVTSATGSSQVLETLGVKLDAPPAVLRRCLDETGFCFCYAPAHHPAMKHAAPIRAELGFRTIFNVLGPLTNPAGARRQVMGVFDPALTQSMAHVLERLGSEAAMVVHGRLSFDAQPSGSLRAGSSQDSPPATGLSEISTAGPTRITRLRKGVSETFEFDPRSLGIPVARPEDLMVDSPAGSAAIVRDVLSGKRGPARDIVLLNAAAALITADLVGDWKEGMSLAAEAIDQGRAMNVLANVIAITAG